VTAGGAQRQLMHARLVGVDGTVVERVDTPSAYAFDLVAEDAGHARPGARLELTLPAAVDAAVVRGVGRRLRRCMPRGVSLLVRHGDGRLT
jgi:hypothetical protein